MLSEWFLYITGGNGNAGNTVGQLQNMASADPTIACRLAWFIEKRRQQFLLSCLTAEDEGGIDHRALDFHDVRQRIRDNNFQFEACDFLLERLPGGRRTKNATPATVKPVTPAKATRERPRGVEERNPQTLVYDRNPHDSWQTFIDHARSGPIPNMCLRWHLKGVCSDQCFIRASHVEMTDDQRQKLKEWIAKCRSRMGRPGATTGTHKKPK